MKAFSTILLLMTGAPLSALSMAGDWTLKTEYDGPGGKGEVSFPVTVTTSAVATPNPSASVPTPALEDARKSFYPVTARVTDLAKAARRQTDSFTALKIYKCPMAPKPGQTSLWIQLKAPLRNPFYGSEMIDCGSEVTP